MSTICKFTLDYTKSLNFAERHFENQLIIKKYDPIKFTLHYLEEIICFYEMAFWGKAFCGKNHNDYIKFNSLIPEATCITILREIYV